jgi:ankyrin repeat protein
MYEKSPDMVARLSQAGATIDMDLLLAATLDSDNKTLIALADNGGRDILKGERGSSLLTTLIIDDRLTTEVKCAKIRTLVECGVDPNSPVIPPYPPGYEMLARVGGASTVLHSCVTHSAPHEIFKTLVECGADSEKENSYGITPLSLAMTMKVQPAVESLVELSAADVETAPPPRVAVEEESKERS